MVQAGIAGAGLFPGVLEMLLKLKANHKLYLNSATPTAALRTSARRLGVDAYFEDLMGSEFSKVENLKKISAVEKLEPDNILMVGDGADDLAGAREFGCAFVGIANKYNNWSKENIGYPVFKQVTQIWKF